MLRLSCMKYINGLLKPRVAWKINGVRGQPYCFSLRLINKVLLGIPRSPLTPANVKMFSMDLNVKYIPYVIRRVPVQEQKLPFRTCIDSKRIYFIGKRIFDLAFSSLFVVAILSWVLPVIALLIKLDSRGPVFFLQKRTGKGGKSFVCYKFRTMVVNSEADRWPALKNDKRITRVGKFLRDYNLDEFPQFFNVLLGSMSIVGPRPHMIVDCNKFSSVVPRYKLRNFVKPGITGLAR
jgi:putative colanic acid biosynthesis UDP-glucose lipid carrier transferase